MPREMFSQDEDEDNIDDEEEADDDATTCLGCGDTGKLDDSGYCSDCR